MSIEERINKEFAEKGNRLSELVGQFSNADFGINSYKCPLCQFVMERESDKSWIRSYCNKTGAFTRLIKQTPTNQP